MNTLPASMAGDGLATVPVAAASSLPYEVLVDIDFSALDAADYSAENGDQSKTLGGKTWTATRGNATIWGPDGSTGWRVNGSSASTLQIALATLLGSYTAGVDHLGIELGLIAASLPTSQAVTQMQIRDSANANNLNIQARHDGSNYTFRLNTKLTTATPGTSKAAQSSAPTSQRLGLEVLEPGAWARGDQDTGSALPATPGTLTLLDSGARGAGAIAAISSPILYIAAGPDTGTLTLTRLRIVRYLRSAA